MNWIKKFAQWLLSEELAEERKHYQKINDDLRADKEALEKSNEGLRRLAFGRRKHLVSQLMLECIVKCLPDPNAVGTGGITASDIKMRNMGFVDELGGRQYDHKCFVKEITTHEGRARSDCPHNRLQHEYLHSAEKRRMSVMRCTVFKPQLRLTSGTFMEQG